MTYVTRGLTAKKPGSALCLALVIEYRTTLLFYLSTLYSVPFLTLVGISKLSYLAGRTQCVRLLAR